MSLFTLALLSLAVSAATVWGALTGLLVGLLAYGIARRAWVPQDEALFWALACGGAALVAVWQVSAPAVLRLLEVL